MESDDMGVQVILNVRSDDVQLISEEQAKDAAKQADATVDGDPRDDPRNNPANRDHFVFHVPKGARIGGWDQVFRRQ